MAKKLKKKWISIIMAGMLLMANINPAHASDLKQEEDVQKSEQTAEESIQEETEQNTENEVTEADTEFSDNVSTETMESAADTAKPTEEDAGILEENILELSAGNSISGATSIPLSGNVNGRLEANSYGQGNKADFYKIAISGNSSICLNVRVVQYLSSMDIKVYNSNGEELIKSRLDWNSNLQQGISDTTCYLDPGIYYIELGLPYYPLSGNYTMQLSYAVIGNIDVTYDDMIAVARPIPLTTTFTGVMAHGENSDVYRIDVARPGIISCKFNAYMRYINLNLIDKDGNTLWSERPYWNENIGYSTNDYKLCLEKGTYYLQVYSNGYAGKYTMQNIYADVGSNEIENNDSIASANSITFEQTYNGLLADGETSDFYRFSLAENAEIRVNFTAYMRYVSLKLYDMYGNGIESNSPYWNENLGYSNNIYSFELPAGTYHLQVCPHGGYRGHYQFSIKIPLSIANANISCASSKIYTGKDIRPGVTVTYGGQRLSQNVDYTVEYSDNYWIGKATVKISGMGNYVGEKVKTFKIVPKKAKLTSLKNKKTRKMYVYWKPDSSVEGFQICYSTNKKFKGAKKTNVSRSRAYYNYKAYYKVIGKLKKNKKYYVKVRAYGYADGKKIYGAYSNVKSIKIKK